MLRAGLGALALSESDLALLSKGDPRKVTLASAIRERTMFPMSGSRSICTLAMSATSAVTGNARPGTLPDSYAENYRKH